MADLIFCQQIIVPGFFPGNIPLYQYVAAVTVFSRFFAPCNKLLLIFANAKPLVSRPVHRFDNN
ncbi:MAG TPA: hypothetical protein DCG37_06605, partial [Lachnospiraceae bacterium]|nr:hypothetical protein [Lachnospiraceae bacterium]